MLEVNTHQVPHIKRTKVRNIGPPLKKLFPMAFFDGAAAASTGGAGACLWLNEQHYFSIILGYGYNTNTRVELLAL